MALQKGKSLNIVLFDRSDVEDAIDHGFADVLTHKLREAGERGDIYAHYQNRRLPSAPRRPREAPNRPWSCFRTSKRRRSQDIMSKLAHIQLAFLELKGGVSQTDVVLSARYLTEEYNVLALYDEQSLPYGDAERLREMPYETLIDVPGGLSRWRSTLFDNSADLDLDLLTAH